MSELEDAKIDDSSEHFLRGLTLICTKEFNELSDQETESAIDIYRDIHRCPKLRQVYSDFKKVIFNLGDYVIDTTSGKYNILEKNEYWLNRFLKYYRPN